MFSWVVEIWSPMREAGIDKYLYIDWFRDHPIADDLKIFRWNEAKLGGMAHVDWKAFDHPDLGPLEIGGWNRFHAFGNPPPQFLERELAKFPKWLIWQALLSPKLELLAAQAQAVGKDTWVLRLVVQNTGWLPSYVSKRALDRKVVGISFWPDYHVTDDRAKIEWVVRGRTGDRIALTARHERAGAISTEVTLG
jgi:hypothetical protein